MTDRCTQCGLPIESGVPKCKTLFDEILALQFTHALYFGVHRLFVDAYCLQHPDHGCVSFKSFAAHLAHLCWSLERGGSRAVPNEQIRRWVERHPHLAKPPLPREHGALTIAHVARSPSADAHHRAVEEWARAVWAAYQPLHSLARTWVDLACGAGPQGIAVARSASHPERRAVANDEGV
jgi:hypothetical protein